MKLFTFIGTACLALLAFAAVRVWYSNFRVSAVDAPKSVAIKTIGKPSIREPRRDSIQASIARPAPSAVPNSDAIAATAAATAAAPTDSESDVDSNARFERDSAEDETRRLRDSTVLNR